MPKKKVEIELDGAKKVIEVPEPLKRKCEIRQVLPVSVIQLLASAPHNETVRNVLLAHLKVPVPEELKTYKDIQDWIEFNIEPPKLPIAKMKTEPGRAADLVNVMLVATEREHGMCSYSEDLRGQGTMGMSREDILEAAVESEDADDFFRRIVDDMVGRGVRDHIAMDAVEGSTSHSDYEASDSDGVDVEIHRDGTTALKNALQVIDRETYERLFE